MKPYRMNPGMLIVVYSYMKLIVPFFGAVMSAVNAFEVREKPWKFWGGILATAVLTAYGFLQLV